MITAKISVALSGSLIIFMLVLIVLITTGILFYRYTLPPLPTTKKIIFTVLRSTALTLLLFIFFEPILRFMNVEEKPPLLAVLIDNSQSMNIKDKSGERKEELNRILQRKNFNGKLTNAAVEYFTFSSRLSPPAAKIPDSISYNGEATNISAILGSLKNEIIKNNIQSVVLITDGNYTEGKNPLYAAKDLTIPIYTIGVGDTNEQKDVGIRKVITNNLAYSDTRVPVDVTIKSSGYDGNNVEVAISEGQKLIDRKIIKLLEGIREYPVRLTVEPVEEGMKKYIVTVSKLPGELTERNNSQAIFMKVLKNKLRVILIAGAPSPDVSAIRQALIEDRHFSVDEFVQKNSSEFYDHQLTRQILDTSDCLILIGYPNTSSNSNAIFLISEAIEKNNKPLLFVNSKSLDYSRLKMFGSSLPFTWSNTNSEEVLVLPTVVEREKHHPLVFLDGNFTAENWGQLPPIYKTQTIFQTKPEADALVQVNLQNVIIREPLVVIRNINRQKSIAITGYGVWRWRLLAQQNKATDNFLTQFFSNSVRWLTTKEDDKKVKVSPLKEIYTTTESVEFTGQVYDEQLKPTDVAEVEIELQHDKEKFNLRLNPTNMGRYEGAIDALKEGDYTYTAKAILDGKLLGEDKGRFSVGQTNVEFIETRMNKPLLEQMAFVTGGKYYDAEKSETVTNDINSNINFTPKEITHTNEIELWNWKYSAVSIILLLATEWFLRKRSGML